MYQMKKICIIGGDDRMYRLGRQLKESGLCVEYFGFEKTDTAVPLHLTLEDALNGCDCAVLPVPLSRDGKTVFAPLGESVIELDNKLSHALTGKRIYTSNADMLIKSGDYDTSMVFDYFDREPVKIENAMLTAEGAVFEAIKNSDKALYLSSCLVAGWGRIGKALSRILRSFGAEVTVSARSSADLAWIRAEGFIPVRTSEIKSSGRYDFIFNTIPNMVFTKNVLENTASNALVIDLASMPGGVDKEACEELKIKMIHALSLPGKTAPEAAAGALKKSLMEINKNT